MNTVFIIGRLSHDPQLKFYNGETCTFITVFIKREQDNEEEQKYDFIDVYIKNMPGKKSLRIL